jgi:hypothetical protein
VLASWLTGPACAGRASPRHSPAREPGQRRRRRRLDACGRGVTSDGDEDLGHSQIGLTMNTYTHVLPGIERTAIDAAARAIFE